MRPRSRLHDGRLAHLYRANAQDATRIVHLLCSADPDPTRKVNKAFIKTIAAFRDLRNPLTFEASLHRAVINECKPPLWQRMRRPVVRKGPPGSDGDAADRLWEAFEQQSHRRKAALVLRYLATMTDDQVADVLGTSTGAARTLVNRGLAELQPTTAGDANPARVAAELQRAFRARADGVEVSVEPDRRLLRRASAGRRAAALGVVTLSVAGAVGGTIGIRAATEATERSLDTPSRSIGAPSPSPSLATGSLTVLSLEDVGLTPDVSPTATQHDRVAASGSVGDAGWQLAVEKSVSEEICLVFEVAPQSPTRHCQSSLDIFQASVDASEGHDATFITGYALDDVRRMTLAVDDRQRTPIQLVDPPPGAPAELDGHFFVVVLPTHVEAFSSEEEAAAAGGDIIRTVLEAKNESETILQRQAIYLALVQDDA